MIDKKANDEKLIKEKKKAARLKLGGFGLMVFGGLEVILSSLNPLLGITALALGFVFFNKGRKLTNAKK